MSNAITKHPTIQEIREKLADAGKQGFDYIEIDWHGDEKVELDLKVSGYKPDKRFQWLLWSNDGFNTAIEFVRNPRVPQLKIDPKDIVVNGIYERRNGYRAWIIKQINGNKWFGGVDLPNLGNDLAGNIWDCNGISLDSSNSYDLIKRIN